ncbi:MAG: DinB family protein [Pseudomonadota bacterium]
MITPDFCRVMAAYNSWQNKSILRCVDPLEEDELTKDRGVFFGSLEATLNHLLWGDLLWMSRFDGGQAPSTEIASSTTIAPTMAVWAADRVRLDARIEEWARHLTAIDLTGDLTWFSGSINAEVSRAKAVCVTHFFNHQTHHRGQIHAMLTAAGQSPDRTDLVFMPEV